MFISNSQYDKRYDSKILDERPITFGMITFTNWYVPYITFYKKWKQTVPKYEEDEDDDDINKTSKTVYSMVLFGNESTRFSRNYPNGVVIDDIDDLMSKVGSIITFYENNHYVQRNAVDYIYAEILRTMKDVSPYDPEEFYLLVYDDNFRRYKIDETGVFL